MFRTRYLLAVLPALTSAAAQEAPIGRASVAPPAVASAPPQPGGTTPLRIQVSDEAPQQARARLDDEMPPPIAARYLSGPQGDVLVAPASGDARFLGFAAGDWAPPADERIDPSLIAAVEVEPTDGRPAPRTWAFAHFGARITEERLAELERGGASVLGFHPSNCVRIALAPEQIDAVAHLPFVSWLGVPRPWQKVHPRLSERRAAAAPTDGLELWVSVYESDLGPETVEVPFGSSERLDAGRVVEPGSDVDTRARRVHSNGWQQRALENLGLEVLEYVDSVRAFRVRALSSRIDAIVARDFVQFVESVEPTHGMHNDSVPMVNGDFVRYYLNGGTNQAVVAGQIDSGFDAGHVDFGNVWGWGWSFGGTGGAWNDPCEHGSHVAGTFLGSGGIDPEFRGNAPGLGWGAAGRFYNIKTSDMCSGWTFSLAAAHNILHTPIWDGSVSTPIPHVINNSWGSDGGPWIGSELDARLIDGEVYGLGQMHVFAAGNDGPGSMTLGLQPAAKNAFTVGNVGADLVIGDFPGTIESDSSRGPAGDFRWKPNVTAPGRWIESVDANSGSGHSAKGGTSMATPHVAGTAALLMDNIPWLRYVPERTASLLMATALTKNGVALTYPTDAHLDSYGAGRIDAFRANFGTSDNTWTNWGTFLPANNYTWADFTVLPGCTRMVVCMHYVEPAASAGASKALLSDFDLHIDAPPIDPNFNSGDYNAQQSSLDNTEIRVIDNPAPGTWRWKIWPWNAPEGVYYGLTVSMTYDDVTPAVSVSTVPAKTFLKPYEETDVTVTVSNNDYVATNVVLVPQYAGFGDSWATRVSKRLADLIVADDFNTGYDVPLLLGNIPATGARQSTYRTLWTQEGIWGFTAYVQGENTPLAAHMGVVTVDGTPPQTIGNLQVLTHELGVWYAAESLAQFQWDPANDGLSGMAGYSHLLVTGAPQDPDAVVDIVDTSSFEFLYSAAEGWYYSVRAVDKSGNAGGVASIGPILIDGLPPTDPGGFTALAHQVDVPSGNPHIVGTWSSTDAHSGIAGYAAIWDEFPDTDPGFTILTTQAQLARSFAPVAPTEAWLHVRAIDNVGNASGVAHFGPFPLVPFEGVPYCTAKLASLGCLPAMSWSGTPVSAWGPDDFHALGVTIPGGASGVLRWGTGAAPMPIAGTLGSLGHTVNGTIACVTGGGSVAGVNAGGTPGLCDGVLDVALGEAWFAAQGLGGGSDLYLQFQFTDPAHPDGSGMGHTDALHVVIVP